ncbi:MAG: OmpW family outer membrane protein [Opitutaceae bacterium]|jgi:outer membrane protein
MKSPRSLLISTLLAVGLTATAARAASPWSVRIATTYLQTVDGSTNAAVPVNIDDKFIPEFDVSYAFTPHWSADLVLTVPQEQHVRSAGASLGTFQHLPPTLLAKYTINPDSKLRFYVGAGVNFTLIFNEKLGGGTLKLDDYSVGPAGQVGCDYTISEHWSLNLDVKRAMLRTDVTTTAGVKVTELHLDPWLYSVGLRYQF